MADFDLLPPRFEQAEVEKKWRAVWSEGDFFDSAPAEGRDNYCIMLPPPNVTGTLHMGHAFQHTLMDALARRERMRGRNVLWQAGTDHAGIATQIVVKRELAARGIDPENLSREEFLRHAWEWKETSGGVIGEQMRRLGASCDWKRERFTMDEKLSQTVRDVFVALYEEGLIYRGKRLVNWDPVILTAVSDLEVTSAEEKGAMHYVRYPFVGDEENGITIATTRPETILVDGAVAVHPDDERFQKHIGRKVWVPMTEPRRAIEIIADSHVESSFGSGCVKITAAHDFNDYEVARRHPDKNIPLIVLFTPKAEMNENAPAAYRGMDRFAAREKIVADLRAAGLLIKVEPHLYKLPRGDRSGAVVEPMLTDQWFMKMDLLADKAMRAAADGETRFIPNNWRKVYDQWLGNIQDWCLSRQLMWGHRIPAWRDSSGKLYVARNEKEAREKAGGAPLQQEDDVLDTWFSSALWPFSTLDWPDKNNAHYRHYFPTSVLVTGFDIIFFWVARMMMMSKHLTGHAPFRDVYITGLVRDGEGQKMSKSKGNILDPLDLTDGIGGDALVEKRIAGLMNPAQAEKVSAATRRQFPDGIPAFGADALRFTFASLASHGRDIKFDLSRCGGYRNFCNKLWNASRFVIGVCSKGEGDDSNSESKASSEMSPPSVADRWIVSRLQRTEKAASEALDNYRFDLAASALHQFVWRDYCDWYVEIAKHQLRDASSVRRTRRTLARVLEAALRLLHPLTPFITEELWQKIAPLAEAETAPSLLRAKWPTADESKMDSAAEAAMDNLMAAVDSCRQLRGELSAPPSARPLLLVAGDNAESAEAELQKLGGGALAAQLAGCADYAIRPSLPSNLPQTFAAGLHWGLEWKPGDSAQMRARLQKKLQKAEEDLSAVEAALANKQFIARAPAAVADAKRARRDALLQDIQDIRQQLGGESGRKKIMPPPQDF